jgi:hypothetical protein
MISRALRRVKSLDQRSLRVSILLGAIGVLGWVLVFSRHYFPSTWEEPLLAAAALLIGMKLRQLNGTMLGLLRCLRVAAGATAASSLVLLAWRGRSQTRITTIDFNSPLARQLWLQAQEQRSLAEKATWDAKVVHAERVRELDRQAFEQENAWQQAR